MNYTNYLIIPNASLDKVALTKYEYTDTKYDDEGEVVSSTKVKPTWQEAIDRNPRWYAPRTVGEFTIIKDQFSALTGDTSALYKLGKKKPIGTFTLMNHDEILSWIADNEVVEEI